jgi:hypothetical protein
MKSKLWKQNIRKKLCLSFSKSRLKENIVKLRAHNDDLRTLSSQTRQFLFTAKSRRSKTSRTARHDIQKYRIIGKAFCQVYESLRKACTKHTNHMTHFGVKVEHVILGGESSLQVKFDMAFAHRVLTDDSGLADLI